VKEEHKASELRGRLILRGLALAASGMLAFAPPSFADLPVNFPFMSSFVGCLPSLPFPALLCRCLGEYLFHLEPHNSSNKMEF
jgi:hypothetical protein